MMERYCEYYGKFINELILDDFAQCDGFICWQCDDLSFRDRNEDGEVEGC